MDRTIKCINEDGIEVVFGSEFRPFLLEDCEGKNSYQVTKIITG